MLALACMHIHHHSEHSFLLPACFAHGHCSSSETSTDVALGVARVPAGASRWRRPTAQHPGWLQPLFGTQSSRGLQRLQASLKGWQWVLPAPDWAAGRHGWWSRSTSRKAIGPTRGRAAVTTLAGPNHPADAARLDEEGDSSLEPDGTVRRGGGGVFFCHSRLCLAPTQHRGEICVFPARRRCVQMRYFARGPGKRARQAGTSVATGSNLKHAPYW